MDTEGNERQIDDEVGHVIKLVEAIKDGSGKKPQANQRIDCGIDAKGLPPDNLFVGGGGMGQPQYPGATFLDG